MSARGLISAIVYFILVAVTLPVGLIAGEGGKGQAQEIALAPAFEASAPNQQFSLGKEQRTGYKVSDELSWPAKAGEAEICLWKDDKFAAASITIDDNCAPDHKWWLEQCKKHGIKVTWFVISGGVDRKNKAFNGTWKGWAELAKQGMGIGSHSITHGKSDDKRPDEEVIREYAGSKKTIEDNIRANGVPDYKCLVVAYPWGKGKDDIGRKYYIAARGTVGTPNNPKSINYAHTCKGGISADQINAILGLPAQKTKWLNNKKYKRGWVTPLYHYVPHGRSKEEKQNSLKKAEEDIAYLASKKDVIWIDTFEAVAKYGQERDSATLKTVSSDADKIELSLVDNMYDEVFDYPLTLKVRLPEGWESVRATQGEGEIAAVVVKNDGKPYALVQAVPDRGNIVLQKP